MPEARTSKYVNTPSADYQSRSARLMLAETLLGGTRAMREAGETYLPKNEGESVEKYTSRISRSFLYNVFGNTVTTMAGKPVEEPVLLGDDTPPEYVEWAKNIDNAGRDLTTFTQDILEEAIAKGITYILVDHTQLPMGKDGKPIIPTKEDEKTQNLRPYFFLVNIAKKTYFLKGLKTYRRVLTP